MVADRSKHTKQLKKTHANRRNTSKLRKHLHQFDNTHTTFRKLTANTGISKCCACAVKLMKMFS